MPQLIPLSFESLGAECRVVVKTSLHYHTETSPGMSSSVFDAGVIDDVVVVRDAKLLVTDGPPPLEKNLVFEKTLIGPNFSPQFANHVTISFQKSNQFLI
jgi:hypothetical protein